MLFDNYSTQAAQASLDSLWLNTKVITNNLANETTPGYKAQRVNFEAVLSEAAQKQQRTNGESTVKQLAQSNRLDVLAQTNTVNAAGQQAPASMKQQLEKATANSGSGAPMFRTSVLTNDEHAERVDGNNVSLEKEQTELTRTNIQYNFLIDKLKGHYSGISTAINNMRI